MHSIQPIIECRSVSFSYDGERKALDDISLSVLSGEFLCVLGGNGSGKSTLARHLNALLLPNTGTVLVDGLNTADPRSRHIVRQTAGMVFQNPDDQLVASLVEDDVAFGPENLGVPTKQLRERVRTALAEVGLQGLEARETHALSGGQKQRLAIAGALAMHPKVLILDEASAMLDPRGRTSLMHVCHTLNDAGMTIIMITHFMEEAAEANRVLILKDGSVALEGPPAEVLADAEALRSLNLDIPFACSLSRTLRCAGLDVPVTVSENELAACVLDALPAQVRHGGNTGDVGDVPTEASPALPKDPPANEREQAATPQAGSSLPETVPHALGAATQGKASMPVESTLISIKNLSFAYDAPKSRRRTRGRRHKGSSPDAQAAREGTATASAWVLSNVSLHVHAGEFIGLAGHTGSGKSTLIQHMNGILHPTLGRVLVSGRDIADKRVAAAARTGVGVVFQYPERQLFAETVSADIAFGPRNLGLSDAEIDSRVRESMLRVGLPFEELKDLSPFELSGGQQRRVALAGVLAMHPSVLVLDEPVAGLDPAARRRLLTLIAELHRQGMTIVMASHSMDDLAALCDRVAIISEGRIARIGTPNQVFLEEKFLNSIGLDVPAPQRLANRLMCAGVPLDNNRLYTEEVLARAITQLAKAPQ